MLRHSALLSTLLLAGSAHAALVTVEYSTNITSMAFEEFLGSGMTLVDSVDFGGITVRKGETVTGRFTYDDTTPLTWSGFDPNEESYSVDNAATYTLTFGGTGSVVNLRNTTMHTGSYTGNDQFIIYGSIGTSTDISAGLVLYAPPGTHDAATLPSAADIPAYTEQSPYFDEVPLSMTIGSSYVWISHGEYTVKVISSVPEPATYGMLAAGLGLLGIAARRAKSRAA